jgi:hypothetical protein
VKPMHPPATIMDENIAQLRGWQTCHFLQGRTPTTANLIAVRTCVIREDHYPTYRHRVPETVR